MELALSLAIVAILLSLPALFIAIYVLVCLKAKEYAKELMSDYLGVPVKDNLVSEELGERAGPKRIIDEPEFLDEDDI